MASQHVELDVKEFLIKEPASTNSMHTDGMLQDVQKVAVRVGDWVCYPCPGFVKSTTYSVADIVCCQCIGGVLQCIGGTLQVMSNFKMPFM